MDKRNGEGGGGGRLFEEGDFFFEGRLLFEEIRDKNMEAKLCEIVRMNPSLRF